jgi:hypothetical protein
LLIIVVEKNAMKRCGRKLATKYQGTTYTLNFVVKYQMSPIDIILSQTEDTNCEVKIIRAFLSFKT